MHLTTLARGMTGWRAGTISLATFRQTSALICEASSLPALQVQGSRPRPLLPSCGSICLARGCWTAAANSPMLSCITAGVDKQLNKITAGAVLQHLAGAVSCVTKLMIGRQIQTLELDSRFAATV